LTVKSDEILRTVKLAAPVPEPHVGSTRSHGAFAPNGKHGAQGTKPRRGRGNKARATGEGQEKTSAERREWMSRAQRLKRVFNIDIETCQACGGALKAIACIEDPAVIEKLLAPLKEKAAPQPLSLLPLARAPPAGLFG
jgi:hypothetical protein